LNLAQEDTGGDGEICRESENKETKIKQKRKENKKW